MAAGLSVHNSFVCHQEEADMVGGSMVEGRAVSQQQLVMSPVTYLSLSEGGDTACGGFKLCPSPAPLCALAPP